VLVIDDNDDAAEAIAVFLRLEGHDVQTANDGPQALARAEIFAPEIAGGRHRVCPEWTATKLSRPVRTRIPLLIALTGLRPDEGSAAVESGGIPLSFREAREPARDSPPDPQARTRARRAPPAE